MSLARRQALISLLIWSAVLIGLLAVIASAGLDRFSAPEYHYYRTLSAAILLPGYLIGTWLAWRQRRARRTGQLDERDEQVARRASEATLLLVALILFGVCVGLWEVYKDGTGAPAGWFYVLAYLTVVLVSLIHAAARLVFDAVGDA